MDTKSKGRFGDKRPLNNLNPQNRQRYYRANAPNYQDVIEQFRAEIIANGADESADIIADGKLHRVDVAGKRRGNVAFAYVLHLDGIPAGGYQDFTSGVGWVNWKWRGGLLDMGDVYQRRRQAEIEKQAREAEIERRYAEAAERARRIWEASQPADDNHGYLQRNKVKAHGIRQWRGRCWRKDCAFLRM